MLKKFKLLVLILLISLPLSAEDLIKPYFQLLTPASLAGEAIEVKVVDWNVGKNSLKITLEVKNISGKMYSVDYTKQVSANFSFKPYPKQQQLLPHLSETLNLEIAKSQLDKKLYFLEIAEGIVFQFVYCQPAEQLLRDINNQANNILVVANGNLYSWRYRNNATKTFVVMVTPNSLLNIRAIDSKQSLIGFSQVDNFGWVTTANVLAEHRIIYKNEKNEISQDILIKELQRYDPARHLVVEPNVVEPDFELIVPSSAKRGDSFTVKLSVGGEVRPFIKRATVQFAGQPYTMQVSSQTEQILQYVTKVEVPGWRVAGRYQVTVLVRSVEKVFYVNSYIDIE